MSEEITKNAILDSFILHLNEIKFLNTGDKVPLQIRKSIKKYIDLLKADKPIEVHLDAGMKLWKLLLRKSLLSLSHDIQGSREIFEYFGKYVDFETLLLGVDAFYRDHTIHSLWVYFLGEYLLKKEFIKPEDMQIAINFFTNLGEYEEKIMKISDDTRKSVLNFTDEIWCITALAHDLGYPISSLGKINEKINSILPFYGKFKKQEFDLEQSFIQKEILEKMIEIISSEIMYTESHRPHQVLKPHLYLRLYNSIEKSHHGVLSSYLLFKSLFSMIRTPFYIEGSGTTHDKEEVVIFLSNQAILKAIALHTCDFKNFLNFPSFDSLLVLADEIEEFSRWTRAGNKRSFINDLCRVYIDITKENITLKYVFDKPEINVNTELFFKNKSKVFMNTFNSDLSNLPDLKVNTKPPDITILVEDNREVPHKNYKFSVINNDPAIKITTSSVPEKRTKPLRGNLERFSSHTGSSNRPISYQIHRFQMMAADLS